MRAVTSADKRPLSIISGHPYGTTLFIYISAAVMTGLASVLFMRVFEFVYEHRLGAGTAGVWYWFAVPLLFVAAVELIRVAAPCADGAGIPQVIYASGRLDASNARTLGALVSQRTMWVKVAALLIGLWAGASTGREGPTVHVAACVFFGISMAMHRVFSLPFNMRSAVIAGGSAGLAAAFNTPLAGVTFAIEELSSDYFATVREVVLMAIIVAGITAKAMTGEYTYFGRLREDSTVSILSIVSVGMICGLAGGAFASLLMKGRAMFSRFTGWRRTCSIGALALAVTSIAVVSGYNGIAGPGNIAAQHFVRGHLETPPGLFVLCKMAATLCTYWSGIAGGIFAPCLSMGSGLGAWAGQMQGFPAAACALMGTAAFLSATIQAPITSFVIIYEMSGRHEMLLPVMLASLIGYMMSRALRVKHLYRTLSASYARFEGDPRNAQA